MPRGALWGQDVFVKQQDVVRHEERKHSQVQSNRRRRDERNKMEKMVELTIKHHRTNPKSIRNELSNISRLLLQLPNCTRLCGLFGIDKSSRDFDDDSIDRWSPLLLQKNAKRLIRLRRVF
jgi:hypothetical protein